MNFKLIAAISALAVLSGCKTQILYTGTDCILASDSAKVAYNTELQAAYLHIDSITYSMLKERGPKGSRMENEDIDDEYSGARKIAEDSRETIQPVILQKHCKDVDTYILVKGGNQVGKINELQLTPNDTAKFHLSKINDDVEY